MPKKDFLFLTSAPDMEKWVITETFTLVNKQEHPVKRVLNILKPIIKRG